MMQLHQDYNKFVENNTVIVVIGPEKADSFKAYWEENNFKFYGVPDPKQSVLKLFEQEVNILKLGRMPAQILVDKKGVVRYLHYGNSMKDISDNLELLDIIASF